MELRDLLLLAIQQNASDLHLTEGMPPILRIDGNLVQADRPGLSATELKELLYRDLTPEQIEKFENDLELDYSLAIPGLDRFRVNMHIQKNVIEAAFRRISLFIPTIEALDLPPVFADFARKQQGLVLVTGSTGSGKTTTLAAMIQQINMERSGMVMCIEDPIEYVHTNKRSIIKQREVYRDTKSFSEALKRCLRQDPDVIVVGEMRDLETISTVLTAAETGHLVLGTLHTQDAPQTIERIIDVFPPYQQQQVRLQLAASLQAVVSQQLVPKKEGNGRVLATEIMVVTPAIRNMIREQATEQIKTAIQTGGQYGMRTMDCSLKELCEAGHISYQEALNRARNVEELKQILDPRSS